MQLLHRKKTQHHTKRRRLNPHHFWEWLLCMVILAVGLELVYFSWFYLHTTTVLDAPVHPTLIPHGAKIQSIERKLETIESAVQEREGETVPASQTISL